MEQGGSHAIGPYTDPMTPLLKAYLECKNLKRFDNAKELFEDLGL